jgi:hypothetical protein
MDDVPEVKDASDGEEIVITFLNILAATLLMNCINVIIYIFQ